VTVQGTKIPRPVETFDEAQFPNYILQTLKSLNFTDPTPIQSQGWPIASSGRDMVGIAETGSGKTLAFVLPSIVHINAQDLLGVSNLSLQILIIPFRKEMALLS